MFIELTTYETCRKISVKVSEITTVLNLSTYSHLTLANSKIVNVNEKYEEIMRMIAPLKEGDKIGGIVEEYREAAQIIEDIMFGKSKQQSGKVEDKQ